jgi:hypothetical protein
MKRLVQPVRRAVLLAVAAVVGAGLATYAVAAPPNHANRFEATFHESVVAGSPRCNAAMQCQAFVTGSGSIEGFGAATELLAINQDLGVAQPCGLGSGVDQSINRVTLADGTGILVLRLSAIRCVTASGPVLDGTYEVDSVVSSGVFAGATGTGSVHVDVTTHIATYAGKLKLRSGSADN